MSEEVKRGRSRKPRPTTPPEKAIVKLPPSPTARPSWPSLWTDMDRLFEEFKRDFADLFWPRLLPAVSALHAVREPCCDLVDEGKAYRVRVEMPGIPKDKIEIHATEDGVEVKAEAATEEEEKRGGKVISTERSYSSVYRRLSFPEEVLPWKAEAELKNGILEISVPKKTPKPEPKKHAIKIK